MCLCAQTRFRQLRRFVELKMEMVESNTFLTCLNADRKRALNKQHKREELLGPMDAGSDILKLHGDLQGLADQLDERVESKLNDNEAAFFLAYKNFMLKVQKEFNELKQKADEEETKTRRDLKIQSLEKRLDWFMGEALRLDELCKRYKKDLDKWKGKAEGLEDDRAFLENQIKAAKKNNKTLRGAVQKAQTSAYSALVAVDDAPHPSSPKVDLQPLSPAVLQLEDAHTASGLSAELEQRYQTCVKRLKQQLETEQRLAGKMRTVSDRQFAEPSELESFFLQCVERVKNEITQRRSAQRPAANVAKVKSRKAKDVDSPKVSLSITIEDFTQADRRHVVQLLLSSEHVLQFLYDKLFPPAIGSPAKYAADIG